MKPMSVKTMLLLAVAALCVGCHHGGVRQSAYGPPPEYGTMAEEVAPDQGEVAVQAREKSFVDRHPILAAPRNYFRDSSSNLLVKTFYGTVVGVPVGIAREAWQILYGQ